MVHSPPARLGNGAQDGLGRQVCLETLIPQSAEAVDLPTPRIAASRSDRGKKPTEHLAHIANQAHRDWHVLPDFGCIELDMDELRASSESGQIAGDSVVESEAESDDEVGLLDGTIDMHLAVHAGHAEVKRMCFGKGADTQESRDHRYAGSLRQHAKLGIRARQDHTVAGHDQWTLGRGDEAGSFFEARGGTAGQRGSSGTR